MLLAVVAQSFVASSVNQVTAAALHCRLQPYLIWPVLTTNHAMFGHIILEDRLAITAAMVRT